MFTLTAVPVMFVGLLVLFTYCVLWEASRLVRARDARGRISHGLHLAMAIVMLMMVPRSWWQPFTTIVPMPVSIGLMVLGILWFAWRAARPQTSTCEGEADAHRADPARHRRHAIACALMFTAMTWHLAAMTTHHGSHDHGADHPVAQAPAQAEHAEHAEHGSVPSPSMAAGHGHHAQHGEHAQHDQGMTAPTGHGSQAWWFALVGLPLMGWLLAASAMAIGQLVRATDLASRLAACGDFAMNFGMFWMSTGLLVPILPFMSALHI